MKVDWPYYEPERLSGLLLRVDLQERRYVSMGSWQQLIDHLVRSASVACLARQSGQANQLLNRAATRMSEWVDQIRQGVPVSLYNQDFAPVRGFLAMALVGPEAGIAVEAVATEFLRQTSLLPAGPVHNARLAAGLLCGKTDEVVVSLGMCSLEDAALGAPWKRFVQGVLARDVVVMEASLERWLEEKMEATQTHDWGAYNEVPIEVSGALGLAEKLDLPIYLRSNRILPRFRVWDEPAQTSAG